MLSQGAKVEYDYTRETAISIAVQAGHPEIVMLLLARGEQANDIDLVSAASSGQTNIVKALLAAGVNVNARDFQGNTALMYAASHGNIEITKALLEQGADVNATDAYRSGTPLILAASAGHQDVVIALLDSGADINLQDNEDHSALHEALRREHTGVASTLSERGAKHDSIFQRLLDIDLENFIMSLFMAVFLMVVGSFLYTRKLLVQRLRLNSDENLIRDRVLLVVTHILAWLISTAMYVSIAEHIPSMWGSNSLGAWLIVTLFGTITLFVLFIKRAEKTP